jgi:hypothetical protein
MGSFYRICSILLQIIIIVIAADSDPVTIEIAHDRAVIKRVDIPSRGKPMNGWSAMLMAEEASPVKLAFNFRNLPTGPFITAIDGKGSKLRHCDT